MGVVMARGIQRIVQRQVARWNVEEKAHLELVMGSALHHVGQ